MRSAVGLLLKLVKDPKKRVMIWQNAEKKMLKCEWGSSTKIVELTTNFKSLIHPYTKKWFSDWTRKEQFEDIKIVVPNGVEDYLTQFFGDFMQRPPVEDRHPRHNTVLIDLENSYTKYKGKYYCIDSSGKQVDKH